VTEIEIKAEHFHWKFSIALLRTGVDSL